MKQPVKKLGIAMATIAVLGSTTLTSVANAAVKDSDDEVKTISSIADLNNLSDQQFLKIVGGLNNDDLSQLSSSDIRDLSTQLKSDMNNPYKTEVGYTSIAKAVLKVWKKIPSGIKKKIAKYTSLGGLLKAIDHFTGGEEYVIYHALRYCHVPANIAHVATKIITLFI